jgi:putative membrane protein
MAWMIGSVWGAGDFVHLGTPRTTYYTAAAAVVFSGVLSFFLLLLISRIAIRLVVAVPYRLISAATLVLLLVIVVGVTSWGGLLICAAATGIGLIPVMWGSRRTNCMGVLLLPIALNMSGVAGTVAGWLGLLR